MGDTDVTQIPSHPLLDPLEEMVSHCSIHYFRESSQSLRFVPFRCKDPRLKYTLHDLSKKKTQKNCARELKQTRKTSLKTVTIGERLTPGPLKQTAGDGGQVLRKIKGWLGQCNQAILILFFF